MSMSSVNRTRSTRVFCAVLLAMTCLSHVAPAAARGAGAARIQTPGAPPTGQPSTPTQFVPIADKDWTIEKPLVGRARTCRDGKALTFPCKNLDLLAFLPVDAIGGSGLVTNVWGWTDPVTHREYVFVGIAGGTAFVEITDPVNPRYLGTLPHGEGSVLDIKVYKHYAFLTGEGGSYGMQVFDLTQLRDIKTAPAALREAARYDRVHDVHTLAIDTAAGTAFAVGSSNGGETCAGGLHMIDIRTPTAPAFAGCFAETLGGSRSEGSIHESQCVTYHGPDQRYRGREICLNAAMAGLGIVDVTDKQHPKPIGIGRYPDSHLTHQGWLSEDHRYFFLGDEYDERGLSLFDNRDSLKENDDSGPKTRTIVFDLKDLSDPVVATEYFATTTAIDHNQYVRGHYLYQANYQAGLRILDITDPQHPKEVAYFDTDIYGRGRFFQFSGAWGNYPYFAQSGLVAVASMGDGLFLLRHSAGGSP